MLGSRSTSQVQHLAGRDTTPQALLLQRLKADVNAGKIDVVQLYELAEPIFAKEP
jgi:hypothetical protein